MGAVKHWLLIGALISSPAFGLDFEMSVGRSEFCCLQDGVWWQSPFGFNGYTRSTAIDLGVRQRMGNWSLAARYSDLGSANGLNVATMRDDDFGSFNRTKGCNTASQKNCLAFFSTSQHVAGVMLGGAYGKDYRGIRLEGEAGTFLYQSDMNVQILCPNCGLDSRYAFGAGGTFSSSSEIRRSPYFSVAAKYQDFFLTYRRISSVDGNGKGLQGVEAQFSTGLTNGPVNQILIGVSL